MNPYLKSVLRLLKIMTSRKINDSLVLGLLGGLTGAIAMDLSNWILWRNKKTEGLYGHLAGSMIMSPWKVNKGSNFLLGEIFHMTMGSVIGVLMTLIFKKFGKDYHLIKGGFLATITWGVLYNFGQKMGFYRAIPHLTKSGYSAILNHLIYGLTTSQVIVSLAEKDLFNPKHPDNNLNNNSLNSMNANQSNIEGTTLNQETVPLHYSSFTLK